MASHVIDNVDIFPETTSVSVYAGPPPGVLKGAPTGTAVATATITSGTATFSGLSASREYTAYASVGGADRYLNFITEAAVVGDSATEFGPGTLLYVDANSGSDSNDGSSWGSAKLTIASALSAADEGSTLLLAGKFREQVTLSNLHGGVTFKGAGSRRPAHADSPWPSGASWLAPASPTATTPLLTVRSQGVTVENILFDAPSDAASIKLERNALSGTSEYDASHFTARKCRFTTGVAGIQDAGGCFNVLVDDCFFHGVTDGTGRAIWCSSTAVAAPLHWEIRNSRFIDNDNHIVAAASKWFIHHNYLSADSVTSKIDFTGGVAGNIITWNYLGGTFGIGGGYIKAGAADEWAGNQNVAGVTTADPA